MSEINKISFEELESISGGAIRAVDNPSAGYANIRYEPGMSGEIIARVDNGTLLKTTNKTVTKDGYVWYQVTLATGSDYGWISGSLIGY